MSLNIDDRSLADGTHRSGHGRQSKQPPPHHPPPRYSLQHPQFIEYFYEELRRPNYQYNDDYKDERIVHGR